MKWEGDHEDLRMLNTEGLKYHFEIEDPFCGPVSFDLTFADHDEVWEFVVNRIRSGLNVWYWRIN